ncbi:hypothetical protein GGR56DRAFT_661902 [Xylariaceae sp. FL0804]|nr:hypothetical protein GGR56DRAFT_661902 [Xylariaceae sp. FL0804]
MPPVRKNKVGAREQPYAAGPSGTAHEKQLPKEAAQGEESISKEGPDGDEHHKDHDQEVGDEENADEEDYDEENYDEDEDDYYSDECSASECLCQYEHEPHSYCAHHQSRLAEVKEAVERLLRAEEAGGPAPALALSLPIDPTIADMYGWGGVPDFDFDSGPRGAGKYRLWLTDYSHPLDSGQQDSLVRHLAFFRRKDACIGVLCVDGENEDHMYTEELELPATASSKWVKLRFGKYNGRATCAVCFVDEGHIRVRVPKRMAFYRHPNPPGLPDVLEFAGVDIGRPGKETETDYGEWGPPSPAPPYRF